ncbi:hypothetical protein [Aequorivita sp. Q41]|uniref:NADase-type glycan-binding domain-containing protein n=1 Tax=Aequorivita sp. Q41 TaxID=3153300 RepID=UPI00324285A1
MSVFIGMTSVLLIFISACKEKQAIASDPPPPPQSTKISTDSLPTKASTKELLVTVNKAKIDSLSIGEMKRFNNSAYPDIYAYYNEEKTGDYSSWSEKLFGRCCSNTDLSFNENLYFKITATIENEEHPSSNLSDTGYLTAYAFKEKSNVKISVQLDLENSFLQGEYANQNLLEADEIIMNPIKLSLINGYVKSEATFKQNGRVKELDFYINNQLTQTFILLDTPLVQEISVNAIFKTNDSITLVPKSYYYGSKYDDICITEIQTNLGKTALPRLNKKFNLMELINKAN